MAFAEVGEMVTSHGEASQATQVPVHDVTIARFVCEDIEERSTTLHDKALSSRPN